jgi:hypothetical protein
MISLYVRRRNNAAFYVFSKVWTTKKAVYSRLSRYRITSDHFVCFFIAVMIPSISPAMMDHPTNTRTARQIMPATNETRSQIFIIILLSYFEHKKSA